MSQNYIYISPDSSKIYITTYGNSNIHSGNCLIFAHGFKGFKDWGFGPYLANFFSEQGFFVITFNFSHNGVGNSTKDFIELDKFANNTYSREVDELNQIINIYKSGFFGEVSHNNKVGLIGHSRGGGISIIAASENKNVDALVTWSSISKFDRWSDRQKNEWKEKGYLEALNTRTKQMMRLNRILIDDLEKNLYELLNIEKAIKNLKIPYLIFHGDQDLAVPVSEANDLYNWSDKTITELFKVYRTGHTFNIKHPFEGSTKAFDKVLEKTNHFFQKSFNKVT